MVEAPRADAPDRPWSPEAVHILAKPTGEICNLGCSYCFFLDKEVLYPGDAFRMSDGVLESCIRPLIAIHRTPQVTVAWQGGEPTLMGWTSTDGRSNCRSATASPG